MHRFLKDERGSTAIEYAVIAGLIFMAIILAIEPIGGTLASTFEQVSAGFGGG